MLAMWVPELPFQLACARDAGLRGRPLAFLNPESPRSPVLWFANRRARAEGLAPGDPLDLALRRLPQLRVLDAHPQTWWEAQAFFGDFLQHWTPQGMLLRMGEALVELSGTSRLFGPPQDAAAHLQRELDERVGWQSHGGLSLSATAAQMAARLEHRIQQVGEGFEASFLAPQPLARLPDLAPRIRSRFQRLGLRTFQDLQPMPLSMLCELMPERQAPKLLAQVRGEDRPRLPLLTEPPGSTRTPWRLDPPRLPEDVALASWSLHRLWSDARSPRKLALRWWDVDGEPHHWKAEPEHLLQPPLELARTVELAFRQGATRRLLIRQVELRIHWGLGRARALFQDPRSQKVENLEPALARLRKRYPQHPVRAGWDLAAEDIDHPDRIENLEGLYAKSS
ncbi:MAG: hypothetical protein KGN80_02715 [Acidobacteriota bacterium]|nr:hypothetical protein [Acidobacteriota bacterium]